MRRVLIVMIAAALALLGATAARAWASGSAKPTVQIRHTARGQLLVDRRGFTLYVFSRDSRNHDACVSISGCASIWPVLQAKGPVVAGHGVNRRLLGTISVGHGARQVTYAGHPLYGYIGDSSPGQTEYVGFDQAGGRWYAITGTGKIVK